MAKWERTLSTDESARQLLPRPIFEYHNERDAIRMIAHHLPLRLLDPAKMPAGLAWDGGALGAVAALVAKLATTRSTGSSSSDAATNEIYILKARAVFELRHVAQRAIAAAEHQGTLHTADGAHNVVMIAWAMGKAAAHSRNVWAKNRLGDKQGQLQSQGGSGSGAVRRRGDPLYEIRNQALGEMFPWLTQLLTSMMKSDSSTSSSATTAAVTAAGGGVGVLPPKKVALATWAVSMMFSLGAHSRALTEAARGAQGVSQEAEEAAASGLSSSSAPFFSSPSSSASAASSRKSRGSSAPLDDALSSAPAILPPRSIRHQVSTASSDECFDGFLEEARNRLASAPEKLELAELALLADALRASGHEDRPLLMLIGGRATQIMLSLLPPQAAQPLVDVHQAWAQERMQAMMQASGSMITAAVEEDQALQSPLWHHPYPLQPPATHATTVDAGVEEDGWWGINSWRRLSGLPTTTTATATRTSGGVATAALGEEDAMEVIEVTSAAGDDADAAAAVDSTGNPVAEEAAEAAATTSTPQPSSPPQSSTASPRSSGSSDLRPLVLRVNEASIDFGTPHHWTAYSSSNNNHNSNAISSSSSSASVSAVSDAEFPHEAATEALATPAASAVDSNVAFPPSHPLPRWDPQAAASTLQYSTKEIVKVGLLLCAQHAWHGPFFAVFNRLYPHLQLRTGSAASGANQSRDVLLINAALKHLSPFPHLALGTFSSIAVKPGATPPPGANKAGNGSSGSGRSSPYLQENIYAPVFRGLPQKGNSADGSSTTLALPQKGLSGVGIAAPPSTVILVRDPLNRTIRVPVLSPPMRMTELLRQSIQRVLSPSSPVDAADDAASGDAGDAGGDAGFANELRELLGGDPVESLTLSEEELRLKPRSSSSTSLSTLGTGLDLGEHPQHLQHLLQEQHQLQQQHSAGSGGNRRLAVGTGTYSMLEFAWPASKVALRLLPQDRFRPRGVDCVSMLETAVAGADGWRVHVIPYFEIPGSSAMTSSTADEHALERLDQLVRDALVAMVDSGLSHHHQHHHQHDILGVTGEASAAGSAVRGGASAEEEDRGLDLELLQSSTATTTSGSALPAPGAGAGAVSPPDAVFPVSALEESALGTSSAFSDESAVHLAPVEETKKATKREKRQKTAKAKVPDASTIPVTAVTVEPATQASSNVAGAGGGEQTRQQPQKQKPAPHAVLADTEAAASSPATPLAQTEPVVGEALVLTGLDLDGVADGAADTTSTTSTTSGSSNNSVAPLVLSGPCEADMASVNELLSQLATRVVPGIQLAATSAMASPDAAIASTRQAIAALHRVDAQLERLLANLEASGHSETVPWYEFRKLGTIVRGIARHHEWSLNALVALLPQGSIRAIPEKDRRKTVTLGVMAGLSRLGEQCVTLVKSAAKANRKVNKALSIADAPATMAPASAAHEQAAAEDAESSSLTDAAPSFRAPRQGVDDDVTDEEAMASHRGKSTTELTMRE